MTVTLPDSLDGALAALAATPDATVLAGGTDLMVEVNYDVARPTAVVSLRRVDELRGWERDGDSLVIGAATTFAAMADPAFAALAPALSQAARTVGSPQIRNTGTVGGNIATASPAGDALPVLAALDAVVELRSVRGARRVPLLELIVGVKRTIVAPDELIVTVTVPVARGPQEFLKIGTRNAMVISVASCALVIDTVARSVGCSLGSVSPRPIRCTRAEELLAETIDWNAVTVAEPAVLGRVGDLAASAATPIDDHRSTARYRAHAVAVMARRAVERALGVSGEGAS